MIRNGRKLGQNYDAVGGGIFLTLNGGWRTVVVVLGQCWDWSAGCSILSSVTKKQGLNNKVYNVVAYLLALLSSKLQWCSLSLR